MTVPTRYYPYVLTLPPGSTPAAPVLTPLHFEDLFLRKIDVKVPRGASGSVGFYVTLAGTPVIPWGNPPSWLVLDSENESFEVNSEANGNLVIVAYNSGVWAHTLWFRLAGTPMSLIGSTIPVAQIQELG